MNIISIGLGAGFGSYAAYQLFVSASSDMLGLYTLRHGTGLINYIKIQLSGANPALGGNGSTSGEAYLLGYQGNAANENRFFVWNDAFNKPGNVNHPSKIIRYLFNNQFLHPIVKRVGAKYYTVIGGISSFTFRNSPTPIKLGLQAIGGIVGLFTPTLTFHCTSTEWERDFTVDSALVPVARYTEKPLHSLKYIGLPGVFYQGFSQGMISRITKNPSKLAMGMVKLFLVTALVLSVIAILATYAKVRVYNIHKQMVALTSVNPKILIIISMSLPFLTLPLA